MKATVQSIIKKAEADPQFAEKLRKAAMVGKGTGTKVLGIPLAFFKDTPEGLGSLEVEGQPAALFTGAGTRRTTRVREDQPVALFTRAGTRKTTGIWEGTWEAQGRGS